jgi:hypothetical protein
MMAENVRSLYSPDADAMRRHLEHLFGGYLDGCHDGLIELAWTDTNPNKDGKCALRNAMMFGTDRIEELIEEAARLNSQPNCNVYIGAALRKPGTFTGSRASAGDVLALTCGYVDLDDEGAAATARDRYGEANAKPTIVVVTGRHPHTRAQMWWRLDEPITDQKISETLLKGMAAALGGDSSVTDPPRVMRLAGSIAWPVKPGRKIELTSIVPLKEPGQPVYTVGHLARLFPPVHDAAAKDVKFQDEEGVTRGTNALGMEEKVEDGRERYMVKTINAVLIQLIGETGTAPTAQELFDASWDQYERGTDFTRPGRGKKEYAAKCVYTVKRFHEGKIRGCETIEIVQALYRQKHQARTASGAKGNDYSDEFAKASTSAEEQAKTNPARQFEYLDIDQIKNMPNPQWLVDRLVIEQSLGFIYGPPGCLKTFIALDMALCFATGQRQWWGRLIERRGAVVYISSEGQANLKFRIMAWEQHRQSVADGNPFFLIRQSINFMRPEDVGTLLATVEAIAAKAGAIAAVFVDTVSRVLPGAEENLQKDMTLFVSACDAVRQRFGAVVFGVHHTNANGKFRGSTVMPGAGDFMIEVRREPGAMAGSIFAFKIKDGEDGWEQHFKVEKIALGDFGSNTSLVVDPVDQQPPCESGSGGWPSREICKEILAAIHEQWMKCKPWCHAHNSSRAAVSNIAKRWNLKRAVVIDILTSWTARGIIEEDVYDGKNKQKGYRKILDL